MNPIGRIYPLAGGTAWIAIVLWRQPALSDQSWAEILLLLAALVFVPMGLRLAGPLTGTARAAYWMTLPSALLLSISFFLHQGIPGALLALPWLATTGFISLVGLIRLWRRGLRPLALQDLCRDAGLIFLAIGGGWTLLSRAGIRPMNFASEIVLLTAVHFHFAGFVLPILTGLAGRAAGGWAAPVAAVGVMSGVPLVAAGITADQLGYGFALEGAAAIITAASALLTAGLHLKLIVTGSGTAMSRALWMISSASLAGAMVLAALYGSREWFAHSLLDIPWMRAVHGTLNALGFSLTGLVGWSRAENE